MRTRCFSNNVPAIFLSQFTVENYTVSPFLSCGYRNDGGRRDYYEFYVSLFGRESWIASNDVENFPNNLSSQKISLVISIYILSFYPSFPRFRNLKKLRPTDTTLEIILSFEGSGKTWLKIRKEGSVDSQSRRHFSSKKDSGRLIGIISCIIYHASPHSAFSTRCPRQFITRQTKVWKWIERCI